MTTTVIVNPATRVVHIVRNPIVRDETTFKACVQYAKKLNMVFTAAPTNVLWME